MKRLRKLGRYLIACGLVCALVACANSPPAGSPLLDVIFLTAKTNRQIDSLVSALKPLSINCRKLTTFRVLHNGDGSSSIYDSNIFVEPRTVARMSDEQRDLKDAKSAFSCFRITQTNATSEVQAANIYVDAADNFLSAVNRVRKD